MSERPEVTIDEIAHLVVHHVTEARTRISLDEMIGASSRQIVDNLTLAEASCARARHLIGAVVAEGGAEKLFPESE